MQHLSFCLNPDCFNPVNEAQNRFCVLCGSPTNINGETYPFFSGKYQIQAFLKQNAVSREYKAIAPGLSSQSYLIKKIALTSHHPEKLNQYHQAFNQESPQLLQLNHPNLAKIHDSFSYKNHQIPSLYLVQDWIEGKDLKQVWQSLGNFSTKQIRNILIQILPATQYLHDNNILHLNIKPSTIRLETKTGKLILTGLTGIKSVAFNTLPTGYASIENVMGFACPASDLYSLGVTCIRLITGGFLDYDPWGNIQCDPLYDAWQGRWKWREYLAQQKVKIDDDLGSIFDKLLQPFAEHRYQTVAQILMVLQPKNIAGPATIISPQTSKTSSSKTKQAHLQTKNKQVVVPVTRLTNSASKTAASIPKTAPTTILSAQSTQVKSKQVKSKNIASTVIQAPIQV
jgi:serine/threonine protein kinase